MSDYRGPGFLEVIWFGSSLKPSSAPSPPSVSSTDDTQEDWEGETTCCRERGKEEGGEEPNHAYDREKALFSINHSILSVSESSSLVLCRRAVYVMYSDTYEKFVRKEKVRLFIFSKHTVLYKYRKHISRDAVVLVVWNKTWQSRKEI